jgi:hypothetical protein
MPDQSSSPEGPAIDAGMNPGWTLIGMPRCRAPLGLEDESARP